LIRAENWDAKEENTKKGTTWN